MGAALHDRAADPAVAVVECGTGRRVGFDLLALSVRDVAAGLALAGVRPGDRVAVLVPPGADLLATVYACWRIGAVVVAADAGLGARGLARALGGSAPDHLVATASGLVLAATTGLRVAGLTVTAGPVTSAQRRAMGAGISLLDLARAARTDPEGAAEALPAVPGPDADAVVVFTSGATGPAKGVLYRHGALEAQRDLLASTYGITAQDSLVAAFAPWAVLGPALGIASAIPAMSPTRPGRLTAAALGDAAGAVRATLVWASPAALRSVVESSAGLDAAQRGALRGIRLLMSAGAPVPAALLRRASEVMPAAEPHTPYGMTEALPVADISLAEIDAAGAGDGVCVGHPVVGVEVQVSPLDATGAAAGDLTAAPGVVGEICVRAAHVKTRYDRLYAIEREASRTPGWHRTGDVGHLDDEGRLWVGGRLVHVVATADAVITPVGVEQRVEALDRVRLAALVGIGPAGTAVAVAVVETVPPVRRAGQADLALADEIRAAAAVPLAAVLVVPSLPVDRRHNSKIDRTAVASWAARLLSGGRPGRL
jgi:acyl-coenzyme A synthetase/AMP-(fatty) acid ligase